MQYGNVEVWHLRTTSSVINHNCQIEQGYNYTLANNIVYTNISNRIRQNKLRENITCYPAYTHLYPVDYCNYLSFRAVVTERHMTYIGIDVYVISIIIKYCTFNQI